MRVAALLSAAGVVAGVCTVATAGSSGASIARAKAALHHQASSFLACEVTDTGGINDESFNQSAYGGLKAAAAADPSIQYTYLGSTSTSDYVPNINKFISKGCGIIITVGFDMGTATQQAAQKNKSFKFAIVDYAYSPNIPNVLGLTYETNQDAFLGGYLAAAMSKTGAVGTFGGQNIPPVTIYMDGFVAGVRYYDKLNHASVKALGWNPKPGNRAKGDYAGTGLFTNNFTDQGLGATYTKTLIAQGADIVFPVAGAVGLGAAAAVKQAGAGHYMEWVDTDGCVSAKQYCSLFITSVTKGIAVSVKTAVLAAAHGMFKGGVYVGDLANGGVALAPFHQFASKVPASVKAELAKLKAGIIAGKISLDPNSYPAS
jgi:basic membrane protein A